MLRNRIGKNAGIVMPRNKEEGNTMATTQTAQQFVLVCPVCKSKSPLGTSHCDTCGMELAPEDAAPAHQSRRPGLFGLATALSLRCAREQGKAFAQAPAIAL